MTGEIDRRRRYPTALLFALFFVVLFALHTPLLRLPYFWDEAGYYVPAARDLLLHGELIPHSTPSNAHPPLVMAYLALAWKLLGYSPVVTRTAMLGIATFSLLGVFRLAQRVANTEVAVASALCTALYPVFFAQSSLAHLDLAAAGLTFWALLAYVEDRRWTAALWFSLAVLAKETAILAPLALFAWELLATCRTRCAGFNPGKLARDHGSSGMPQLPDHASGFSPCGLPPTRDGPSLLTPPPPHPAHPLVRLPLRAHRIHFRQPGILPLQRTNHGAAAPCPARTRAALVASRRISQLLLPHLGRLAGHVASGRSTTTAKNARGSRWTYSSPSWQSLPLT